jgi:hypothetical protein
MKMKTTIKNFFVKTFEELSDDEQAKAIEKYADINVSHNWWDYIYEEAERLGIQILNFDIDRQEIGMAFISSEREICLKIIDEFEPGSKIVEEALYFTLKIGSLFDTFAISKLKDDFKNKVKDFYLGLLRGKYKYLTSADAIEESLIANEVEFEFELKERN